MNQEQLMELLFGGTTKRIIDYVMDETKEWDDDIFTPLLCMIIEEHCLRHKLDAVEYAKLIYDLIDGVNTDMGKYSK